MNDVTAEILERYMSAIQLGTDLSDRDLGAIEMAMLMALTDCEGSVRRQLADANAHIEFLRRALDERGELLSDLRVELAALHQSMSEPVPAAPAAISRNGNSPEASVDFTQPEPVSRTPAEYTWETLAHDREALEAIASLELGTSWRKVTKEVRGRIVRATVAELMQRNPDLTTVQFDAGRPSWMPGITGLLELVGMTWSQLCYKVRQ
jgi:hypothetical protein